MTKKSDAPAIRFKGFSDAWEQRKVSELFRVTRGYVLAATQTETTKTDEKPYPVYSSQTKDKGLMGYYKDYLYEDAITWTTDGANAGTVNYRAGKFYCTNVCGVLLSNEVKANQMIAEALNSVAKGYVSYVGNPKLMNNVMADIVIQIPTQAEEREQLSSFFAKLDNLITLHQRKCVFLFGLFQAFISMIFTASTFSWEQRKLGDISEIKTGPFGSTLHADDYVSDGTPIITTEHFKTGALPRSKNGLPQVSDSDYKRLTAYTLDDGDIVFSRVGSVDINALITPFQSNWLFSGRVLRVRPQTDISSIFLHTRLETESIKTDIRTRAVGQTMPSINTEILKITPLVLPSSAAEQEQIGSYFAALDNLITLHQRKGKAAVSGCFLNCFSLEKSSAQSRTLELFGQISNQEIKYIIDGLSILGGKLRNFCVKLIILLSYTRINDIAKYHISRNTECVHNIN